MNMITEITRRDIFNLFTFGMDATTFFGEEHLEYNWYGRLSELEFIKRLYDLSKISSNDSELNNAEEYIRKHAINNDSENGWFFKDDRFGLLNGKDDIFMKFLCAVFHPAVRNENGIWQEFLNRINELLKKDNYELFVENKKISGRDVYGWREISDKSNLFVPFSQRHENEIKTKKLVLTLSKKARNQIYQTLSSFNELHDEFSETNFHYTVTTFEYVLEKITQFYTPKGYTKARKYEKTDNFEEFINGTTPYSVFDAIEFFAKYQESDEFQKKINTLFKLNAINFQFDGVEITSILNINVDKSYISQIQEKGLQQLIEDATLYYQNGNNKIAVEKLWDAFERLKTYYSPALNKSESADKIIDLMSGGENDYKLLYTEEFKALTKIGNNFRIRHHETTKIDIVDDRQFDYFYKRCLSLISIAILYI